MQKLNYLLVAISMIAVQSCAELQQVITEQNQAPSAKDVLTNDEIIRGLKAALNKGTDFAVANLAVEDGFLKNEAVKILLPKEVKPIYERIEKVPILEQFLDNAVVSVNRAAEDATAEAKPIFISAIQEMTIQDGMSILRGTDTAATTYLKEKTMDKLYEAFKPKIEASLSKTYVGDISAERTYAEAINTYNKASLNGILWTKIENNSLAEHTTQQALEALFTKLAEEEKEIRKDPAHRVTDILKRVFGWQF